MAVIFWSRRAQSDLERLTRFLLEVAPESAEESVRRILEGVGFLEEHPLLGRRVRGEVRELVISRGKSGYVALYRFDAGREVVRILAVGHQREVGFTD